MYQSGFLVITQLKLKQKKIFFHLMNVPGPIGLQVCLHPGANTLLELCLYLSLGSVFFFDFILRQNHPE